MTPPQDFALLPRATYRLQLHAGFRFADAARVVPYLAELGISHCYCSPCLKARPGSLHGYDIVDHSALNPELGGDAGFAELEAALRAHGMGLIMDIVPNHMAVLGRDNVWWQDVLENGPSSEFAGFFDIDWRPLRASMAGQVLLPVLDDHYGTVIEGTDLQLLLDAATGAFSVEYHEHLLPVDPGHYSGILRSDIDALRRKLADRPGLPETFDSLVAAFDRLPPRSVRDPDRLAERRRGKEAHKRRLAEMLEAEPVIAEHVAGCVQAFNREPRDPGSVERWHQLLEAQAYRLAYWRVASHEINYRRFFDINDLASIRVENRAVFSSTHERVLQLVADGRVDGLRIDHPDGLFDPGAYLQTLRSAVATARSSARCRESRSLYIVVEKILADGEALPDDWPVEGTTGYEFVDLLARLFVYPNGMPRLEAAYEDFVGSGPDFTETALSAKRLIMQTALASELNVLVAELDQIAEADRHTRDFGLGGLRDALLETVACLPVYRCYVVSEPVRSADLDVVSQAVRTAKRRTQAADTSVFDFVGDVLSLRLGEGRSDAYRRDLLGFVMRLQQYTGAVAAKGVEDTAFYRYGRLLSLNEVGSEPGRGALSVEAFHRLNAERLKRWPWNMLASSTHDSKRSEDVRARIGVLSELAGGWSDGVRRWRELNARFKRVTDDGALWPDADMEYFLYQTLIGAWPPGSDGAAASETFMGRIRAYILKASREAKNHTSWTNRNAEYEELAQSFVDSVLSNAGFIRDFRQFHDRVATIAMYTGLSQTLLKLTSPGVPDVYQGAELWTDDLVDPDNRRPVDFGARRCALDELQGPPDTAMCERLLGSLEDGRAKLYVYRQALGLRRRHPQLFAGSDYLPLTVSGSLQVYLCAFARRSGDSMVVVLAPRWFATLTDEGRTRPLGQSVWKETGVKVPEAVYQDVFTGRRFEPARTDDGPSLDVGRVLGHFPIALLVAVPPASGRAAGPCR